MENGEAIRLLLRAPRAFGATEAYNSGIVIFVLSDWSERRSAWVIMDEVRAKLAGLPGVTAFPRMRQRFGASLRKPAQFVLGVVVHTGVLLATVLTLLIVPVGYQILARRTGSPGGCGPTARSGSQRPALTVPSSRFKIGLGRPAGNLAG